MLVINYSGNRPQQDRFKFAVNGDNNSQTIKFVLKKQQGDIDLSSPSFTIYFLCQSQDKRFVDKAEITTVSEEGNDIILEYKLLGKHTQFKSIDVGVSFENENQEVVYKTASATISIQNGIMADDEIANNYPTELGRIETRLNHSDKKFVYLKTNYGNATMLKPAFQMEFYTDVKLLYTVNDRKATNLLRTKYLDTKMGNHILHTNGQVCGFNKGTYTFIDLINMVCNLQLDSENYVIFPYSQISLHKNYSIPHNLKCCLCVQNLTRNEINTMFQNIPKTIKKFQYWVKKYYGSQYGCLTFSRIQFKFVKDFKFKKDTKVNGFTGTIADNYIDVLVCIKGASLIDSFDVYFYAKPKRFK